MNGKPATCKHGIEQPTPQDIERLANHQGNERHFVSLRYSQTFLSTFQKLWDRAHPCYTCYTEF